MTLYEISKGNVDIVVETPRFSLSQFQNCKGLHHEISLDYFTKPSASPSIQRPMLRRWTMSDGRGLEESSRDLTVMVVF